MSHEPSAGSLGVLPGAWLRPTEEHTLQALASYDLGQIRHRLQIKAIVSPEYIDEALLEFRRFLALHALVDAPVTMYSWTVDAVWHTTIMFTQRYAELCEQAFGRRIPHRPDAGHEYGSPDASDEARRRFAAFRASYERYFGLIGPLWLADRPWAMAP
jgi:hypothetical protein